METITKEISVGELDAVDTILRKKVENNIFLHARGAVEPWDLFPWHLDGKRQCDSWKVHSSQALAIDVFGTIKMLSQEDRDAVLGNVARKLKLPEAGSWQVELEWCDKANRLRESGKKTQVDARASSPEAEILFECKFTEKDGGCCSQVNEIASGTNKGMSQCTGDYEMQTNPTTDEKARCALTGKGIRYWELIPKVFDCAADENHYPCPFNGPWYQWMRNFVLACAIAEDENKRTGFVIIHADSELLPFARLINSDKWLEFEDTLNRGVVPFLIESYESLLTFRRPKLSDDGKRVWRDLQTWVSRKIDDVEMQIEEREKDKREPIPGEHRTGKMF